MIDNAMSLFPEVVQTADLSRHMHSFASACFKQADEAHGIDIAIRWAQGYKVPKAAADIDEPSFARATSIWPC